MSFSGKSNFAAAEPKLAGINPNRTSSNETARVVPYVAGVNRLGLIFLGEAFNVRADAVYQDAKKASVLSGYNYYASFAALISLGTLDAIYAVYIEEELVWEGTLERSGDYTEFSIEGRGNVRLYWGTETQGIDPTLAGSDQNHPAYRGQAYLVFTDYFIGYNRTAIGNLEVVVARWPAPSFLNAAGRENVIRDANVPAIIHDWITNVRCLHLPESRLDTDDLGDQADTLYSECLGVSPVVTRATGARQLMVELLEYVDGYLKTTPAGKLTLGLVRETPCADITIAFDETDLAELPANEPEDWDQTFNSIAVNFSNRDNHYQPDPAQAESQANRQITGGVRQKTFERRWFTRQLAAQTFANILASRLAQPGGAGRLVIRKSRLQGLEPGDVFRLSYAPDALCHLLCRCIDVNRPAPDRPVVEVAYEVDRGNLAAQFFTPPEIEPPTPTEYVAEPIEHAAVMEMPFTVDQGFRGERLVFFAARPNGQTTAVTVHRQLPSTSYASVLTGSGFAMRGTLHADYGADTLKADNLLGVVINFDAPDNDLSALTALTLGDAVGNEWLLWINDGVPGVLSAGGNAFFRGFFGELLSVFGASLLAAGRYRLWTIRERFDTPRLAHLAGAECYLIRRRALTTMLAQINELPYGGSNFKFQTRALGDVLDLADADPVVYARTVRCFADAQHRNLRGNGTFRPALGASDDLVLTWDAGVAGRPDDLSAYSTGLPGTILHFVRISDGDVFHTVNVAAGTYTHTITDTDLLTAIGTLDDFRVIAYGAGGAGATSTSFNFTYLEVTIV